MQVLRGISEGRACCAVEVPPSKSTLKPAVVTQAVYVAQAMYFLNVVGAIRFGVGYYLCKTVVDLLWFEWLNCVHFALYFTVGGSRPCDYDTSTDLALSLIFLVSLCRL